MRPLVLPVFADMPTDEDDEEFSLAALRVNAEAVYGWGIVMSFVAQITHDLQTRGHWAKRELDLREVALAPGVPLGVASGRPTGKRRAN